jgi:hypothetical protein
VSEQEKNRNFLARWSQRKRDVAAAEEGAGKSEPVPTAKSDETKATSAPAFDVSSLPSIESIGANTDIRAFLQPGVPAELRAAALRRAWIADPAIRNFAGLQEYDFVFNSPETFGMGGLAADTDVMRLLADVFGKQSAAEEARPVTQASKDTQTHARIAENERPAQDAALGEDAEREAAAVTAVESINQNAAQQQDEPEARATKPRRHGSALPRS